MNRASVPSPLFPGLAPATAALLVIALTTAFRLFYSAWLPILPDEAYYFQWSRHLDASYFSKGPAVAYTIWAGTALMGENTLGVRFFAVMLSAGTAWQVFLLARRWYDEATGLIAVLVTNVIPLYALGSVVMTIDPLSAFFWIWAANLFSQAIETERIAPWLWTGFAVGSGFLAKYLNALELLAFLLFLLLLPKRRRLLAGPHFWLMLLVAVLCTTPVWWWNEQHGWVSLFQLGNRGHLAGPFTIQLSLFLNFLGLQALVLSPGLLVALLISVGIVTVRFFQGQNRRPTEAELFLLLLFFSVFLLYAVLGWHLREEPNWPAVSYLSLIVVMAAQWRWALEQSNRACGFIAGAFLVAWLQTVLMHDPAILHLPQKLDPMGRVVGWQEIADHLQELRRSPNAPDVLIADAYKEASVFSFDLPDRPFIYTVRNVPAANQFDLWPPFPTAPPHRALWIAGDFSTPEKMRAAFNTITLLERVQVSFKGKPFRIYTIYSCENKPEPKPGSR